jgi:hypothetical protein
MKKIIHSSILIFAVIVCFTACKKDGQKLTLQPGSFSGTVTASTDTVVLSAPRNQDTVITFSWASANFGKQPLVLTYTIQVDKKSDTATWANAKTFAAGSSIYTYSFTGLALNNLVSELGLPVGDADTIAVRIRADANQFNGSASTVAPSYSNTILITVTPYSPNLFIPGAYQNWDPTTAPVLNPFPGQPGLFEAYENLTGTPGTIQYFKYTDAPDWLHTNYGDGGMTTLGKDSLTTDGLAGGLSVPDTGYYELWADLNNNTWAAYKTTWSIIGDATPGGWNTDTEMAYDSTTHVWTVTAAMVQAGSFKFRANNDWKIDFGIDANGNLKYSDNLFLTYDPTPGNLTVPVDGTYVITLDLHISGVHTYSIVKQ